MADDSINELDQYFEQAAPTRELGMVISGSLSKGLEIKLDVSVSRIGGQVLEFKKVSKRFDDVVILDQFDYSFNIFFFSHKKIRDSRITCFF